jgi:cytochrome c553
MRHKAILITSAALILTATAGTALSQNNAALAGDIAAGQVTANANCASCHGPDGISSTSGTPHLAGQHAAYILAGLSFYKKGERHNRKMHRAIDRLDESDMANVAAYYGSLSPFSQISRREATPARTEEDPFAAVRELTEECAGCHGEAGNSDIPGTPSLAGQHVTYLVNALRAYQDGLRKNEEMQMFVESLSSSEIEDMAYYYAAMVPKRAEPTGDGDAFAGRAVTAPCAGCHADDGNNKDPKTPRLAGLDAEYLIAAAEAYKEGLRDHDVMREAVSALRAVDVKNMAAYYASKEPRTLPLRKPLTISEWASRCNRCHGHEGRSSDPRFPILAGQDEAYLLKTLKLYHGGDRPNTTMQAMSFLMAESDIMKLAAYYARQSAR